MSLTSTIVFKAANGSSSLPKTWTTTGKSWISDKKLGGWLRQGKTRTRKYIASIKVCRLKVYDANLEIENCYGTMKYPGMNLKKSLHVWLLMRVKVSFIQLQWMLHGR